MPTITTDAAIPASVTIDGETLVGLLVDLLRVDVAWIVENDGCDTLARESLGNALVGLHHAAFGKMFRDCDHGTEAPGCQCAACNGDEAAAATPIFRLIRERADANRIETKSLYGEDHAVIAANLERASVALVSVVAALEDKGVIPAAA